MLLRTSDIDVGILFPIVTEGIYMDQRKSEKKLFEQVQESGREWVSCCTGSPGSPLPIGPSNWRRRQPPLAPADPSNVPLERGLS